MHQKLKGGTILSRSRLQSKNLTHNVPPKYDQYWNDANRIMDHPVKTVRTSEEGKNATSKVKSQNILQFLKLQEAPIDV